MSSRIGGLMNQVVSKVRKSLTTYNTSVIDDVDNMVDINDENVSDNTTSPIHSQQSSHCRLLSDTSISADTTQINDINIIDQRKIINPVSVDEQLHNENIYSNDANHVTIQSRGNQYKRKFVEYSNNDNIKDNMVQMNINTPSRTQLASQQYISNRYSRYKQMNADRSIILQQLNTNTSLYTPYDTNQSPIALDAQFNQLYKTIQRTIVARENNSICLHGESSCGKSLLLKSVLHKLYMTYCNTGISNTNIMNNDKFLTIYLNGLILTDDLTAMKQICYQLQCSTPQSNSAVIPNDFYSYLAYLYDYLCTTEKSLIIVLDHLQSFCNSTRQSMLYNLCDLLHKNDISICIVATTYNVDIYNQLEKRVQSRINFIRIVLSNYTLDNIIDILVHKLSLPSNKSYTQHVYDYFHAYENQQIIQQCVDLSRPLSWYITLFNYILTQSNANTIVDVLTTESLSVAVQHLSIDPIQSQLHNCTLIELQLLCSYYSLQKKYDTAHQINFIQIYENLCHQLQSMADDGGTILQLTQRLCLVQYMNLIHKNIIHIVNDTVEYNIYNIYYTGVESRLWVNNFKLFINENSTSTYITEWCKLL